MNLARINRLLRMIGLLQASRGHNVDSLAVACQVSRRTVFRDLEVLRQAGVPLKFDAESCQYHIPGTYYLPPTNLTSDEALAVLVLCHELGETRRMPFYEQAGNAAVKLAGSLPSRVREQFRNASSAIQINLTPGSNNLNGQATVYRQLVEAISRRECVRIRYDSIADQKLIQTRLSPYRLLFSRHAWYVVGRSSLHREPRTFHVGRIRQLEPLEEKFRLPRGFNLEKYLGNAWHLIPGPGGDREVRIRFQPMVARNVAEVDWHKTQRVQFNKDGTMDFRVTVAGLPEISWWILGYGDQAEVLEPAELRKMVADRAKRMVEQYVRE